MRSSRQNPLAGPDLRGSKASVTGRVRNSRRRRYVRGTLKPNCRDAARTAPRPATCPSASGLMMPSRRTASAQFSSDAECKVCWAEQAGAAITFTSSVDCEHGNFYPKLDNFIADVILHKQLKSFEATSRGFEHATRISLIRSADPVNRSAVPDDPLNCSAIAPASPSNLLDGTLCVTAASSVLPRSSWPRTSFLPGAAAQVGISSGVGSGRAGAMAASTAAAPAGGNP